MSTSGDILLVEDDIVVAEVFSRLLRRAGYTVRIVNDGGLALAALREARPTILILDLILPGMDGFAVLQHIKQQLPVIIITAHPDLDALVPSANIRQVLMKPFFFEELLAAIRAIVEGSTSHLP